ncbi:single-stranded DNA-binding protein [Peribacillus simplex]|uniref:single-stranded DNA-binding protein n=1 Tax=Peribacillus simplex TaxID=1478 RepID=UPI003D280AF6
MNVITLTGNSTRDVELKYTPNGKAVGNGTIAVRRDFKNQKDEYETDFVNFVALGGLSEVMANHIKKGDKFGITGRLQIRIWENDEGKKIYFTEVVVNSFDFPNKSQNNQGNTNTSGNKQNGSQGNYTRVDDDPFANDGKTIDISDDDLPF